MRVGRDGQSLTIDVELDQAPLLGAAVVWKIELNVATTAGRVCGASNAVDGVDPSGQLVAYGYDPAYGLSPLTRRELPEGVCRVVLDGATARFAVDLSGQAEAEGFRVVGYTRTEPVAGTGPGSEDDFGFDATLAEL